MTKFPPVINNRYRFVKKLGQGGMGRVFLVEDLSLDRELLALKLLKQGEFSLSKIELFKREFDLLRQLQHPHIARVYDFGYLSDQEGMFYTSEYVEGLPFGPAFSHLAEGEILELVIQIIRALSYLHSRSFIHNDIKPSNIIVCQNSEGRREARLIDFGLASRKTQLQSGRLYGTASYVAPEKILQGISSPQTDLYSLGITLYYVLCGEFPLKGENNGEILLAHIEEAPSPLPELERHSTKAFQSLMDLLLEKDPNRRLQSAEAVLRAINRLWKGNFSLHSPRTLASSLGRSPLVGREKEQKELEDFLHSLLEEPASGPLFLEIRGEEGIGKGRLLEEIQFQGQASQVLFLRGDFQPGGSLLAPFYQILKDLYYQCSPEKLPSNWEDCRQWMEPSSSSQSSLFAQIGKTWGKVIEEMARRGPVIMVLGNINQISEATLPILKALLDGWKECQIPLGIIFLRRTSPSFSPGQRDQMKKEILPSRGSTLLSLEPFSSGEIEKWIEAHFPSWPHGEVMRMEEVLREKGRGNPRLMEEMVLHFIEEKMISYQEEWHWAWSRIEALSPQGLPGILKRKIQHRPLSSPARLVLEILSIARWPFREREVLEIARNLEEDFSWKEVRKELEEGLFIQYTKGPEGQDPGPILSLRHRSLASLLISEIEEDRKVKIHRLLASALENRAPHLVLAHHYIEGKDPVRSRQTIIETFPLLEETGEYKNALDLVKGGRKLLPQDPELMLLQARSYRLLGRYFLALKYLTQIPGPLLENQTLRVNLEKARVWEKGLQPRRALQCLEDTLEKMGEWTSPLAREIRLFRAHLYERLGNRARGREEFEKLVKRAELLEEELHCLYRLALIELEEERGERAESRLVDLRDRAREGNHLYYYSLALSNLARLYRSREEFEEAYEYFQKSLTAINSQSYLKEAGVFYLQAAEDLLDSHRLWAHELLNRSRKAFEKIDEGQLLGRTHFLMGELLFRQGRMDSSLYHFLEAKEIFSQEESPLDEGLATWKIGELHFWEENYSSARLYLGEALPFFQPAEDNEFFPSLLFKLALIEGAEGRWDKARNMLNQVRERAQNLMIESLLTSLEKYSFLLPSPVVDRVEPASFLKKIKLQDSKGLNLVIDLLGLEYLLPYCSWNELKIVEEKLGDFSHLAESHKGILRGRQKRVARCRRKLEKAFSTFEKVPSLKEVDFPPSLVELRQILRPSDCLSSLAKVLPISGLLVDQKRFKESIELSIWAYEEIENFLRDLSPGEQREKLKDFDLQELVHLLDQCRREVEKYSPSGQS